MASCPASVVADATAATAERLRVVMVSSTTGSRSRSTGEIFFERMNLAGANVLFEATRILNRERDEIESENLAF